MAVLKIWDGSAWVEVTSGGGDLTAHEADTTDVHGIADTSVLVLDTDLEAATDRIAALEAAQSGGDAASNVSYLVSGGSAVWKTGYQYRVSAAQYYLRGTLLSSPQTDVSLSAADASLDRIDVIVVDNTGTVAVVEGTPAAAPVEPAIDPFDQLRLAIVSIPAASTAPTITRTTVFDEAGVGEWTASTGGTGFNASSTNNPYSGTKTIEATSVTTGSSVTLTVSPAVSLVGTLVLALQLRSKALWPAKRGLSVYFRNSSGVRVGNAVTIAEGTYGFVSSSVASYQQIAIPMSAFAVPDSTLVASLRIDVTGSGSAFGFYMDAIVVDGGSVASSTNVLPLASPSKSGTVKTTTQETDPIVYTKAAIDSLLNHAYYSKLAALLEPAALEPFQRGMFSYTVGSSETKYLIASWATRIGSAGRMEVRDTTVPMALRGVTLNGTDSNASGVFLDPSLTTYAAAWTTYHDRLNTLATVTPKILNLTAASQYLPLLPGAYGAIVLRAVNFGFSWIILMHQRAGYNLGNEISDGTTQRRDTPLYMPISKLTCSEAGSDNDFESGAAGTIVYALLPSTWGTITDATSYLFRDDFMGTSLNTGATWTRAQSSAGNVEIDTNFGWLKMIGNESWGANGLYSQSSIARASGRILLCDVYMGRGTGSSSPDVMLGFSTGAGQSYTDFAHGVLLNGNSSGGAIQIFENGNNRGTVGSGVYAGGGAMYRVKITLSGASAATYAIQGGTEYPTVGGATWQDITPGTSSSATSTLRAGATAYSGTQYLGDMRIY
jgi:hypothetical protein